MNSVNINGLVALLIPIVDTGTGSCKHLLCPNVAVASSHSWRLYTARLPGNL